MITAEDIEAFTDSDTKIPEDVKIGGVLSMDDLDLTQRAIEACSKFFALHPDYVPSFTCIANVVVCTEESDKAFVRAILPHFDRENGLGPDMWVLAYATMYIHAHGWDAYIERLRERPEPVNDFGQPLISAW